MHTTTSAVRFFFYRRALCAFSFAATLFVFAAPVSAEDFSASAREMKIQLAEKVLPYWFDTAQDTERGGYLLADDAVKGRGVATEKQIVSQCRVIWTFSHTHIEGYSDTKRNYLKAAKQGYDFFLKHFRDKKYGGYYWTTDLKGKRINDCKLLYGESFAIYAFVEYYRASGDKEALTHAMDLYHTIQTHLHDGKNSGWFEHAERNWKPLSPGDPRNQVEVVGYKSANSHLHLMEALAELYDATHDPEVKESLIEALRINMTQFYPDDPAKSAFHRQFDWKPVTDRKSAGLSYGHNVEFAWLMIRAENVLGREPSWKHFYAVMDHALKYGYDHERGGLYNRGFDNQPATDTDKVWWVQAEMIAALSDALKHERNPEYETALSKLLQFTAKYQADPKDGIWLDTVTADGKPKATGKAHSWKANYHDVRGMTKFIDAFAVEKAKE